MSLTEHLEMSPSPRHASVVPRFIGGPMDGRVSSVSVMSGDVRGTLTAGESGGLYHLVGFSLSEAREYAVYEWGAS